MYADWQASLGSSVEVCAIQLPGRGARFKEPLLNDLPAAVTLLASVLERYDDLPSVFFGHSLGALFAYEVVHNMRLRRARGPLRLIASGCHAPHLRRECKILHLLDDEDLIAELRDYNGTPAELLAHHELMQLMLPLLRADFRMVAHYLHQERPLLDIPISIFAGRQDKYETADDYQRWSELTSAATSHHWFDGDHFFIQSRRDNVLDVLFHTLTMHLRAPAAQ